MGDVENRNGRSREKKWEMFRKVMRDVENRNDCSQFKNDGRTEGPTRKGVKSRVRD